MSLLVFAVLGLLPSALAQISSSDLANVTDAFNQAQIVPDVLSTFNPSAVLNVTFPTADVVPGELLTTQGTAMEPLFSLIGNDTTTLANETFVVIMVDPDAPTPTNRSFSQVRHFVGGGYVLDNSTTNSTMLFNTTAALSEYLSPGPPAGSPPHRYVLLVYVQPPDFNQTAPTLVNASTPILNFNLTTFAEAANLSDPIAGNFFLVGPDDSNSSSTAVSSSVLATSSMSSALLPVTSTNSGPITSTSLITTVASPTATNGGVMLNPLRGIKTALYVCIISVIGYYVI